ncbi:hypothetical protein EXIGLDRAFT_671558 [Exidia glandulosa HHB12029]|uniref:Large ribosomal subunit protein bL28c n=1 Tax=Exidia glandulosa HHB12029 TaxID=1314781 RepID=A0A165K953_EXIGL|nr:hypothetical protein EXIGLDRAFT_671558 [Exidia glandulosa HHB12029]
MLPTSSLWGSIRTIVAQPFKRSQMGLFHGAMKQYGNNVPHSLHKTRRTWMPNIQVKRLYSRVMGEWIKLTLTTRALRCIDKAGGLDEYIMNTKSDLLGWEGMRLRVMLRERMKENAARAPKRVKPRSAPAQVFETATLVAADAAPPLPPTAAEPIPAAST